MTVLAARPLAVRAGPAGLALAAVLVARRSCRGARPRSAARLRRLPERLPRPPAWRAPVAVRAGAARRARRCAPGRQTSMKAGSAGGCGLGRRVPVCGSCDFGGLRFPTGAGSSADGAVVSAVGCAGVSTATVSVTACVAAGSDIAASASAIGAAGGVSVGRCLDRGFRGRRFGRCLGRPASAAPGDGRRGSRAR